MEIEDYGYGHILVKGETIDLPRCRGCHRIVAVSQEERESVEPEGLLMYLNRRMTCCPKPDYYYEAEILKFPK